MNCTDCQKPILEEPWPCSGCGGPVCFECWDTHDGMCGHCFAKDALRTIIAAQWERIVAAGPTGDEHAVDWITEAVSVALRT